MTSIVLRIWINIFRSLSEGKLSLYKSKQLEIAIHSWRAINIHVVIRAFN